MTSIARRGPEIFHSSVRGGPCGPSRMDHTGRYVTSVKPQFVVPKRHLLPVDPVLFHGNSFNLYAGSSFYAGGCFVMQTGIFFFMLALFYAGGPLSMRPMVFFLLVMLFLLLIFLLFREARALLPLPPFFLRGTGCGRRTVPFYLCGRFLYVGGSLLLRRVFLNAGDVVSSSSSFCRRLEGFFSMRTSVYVSLFVLFFFFFLRFIFKTRLHQNHTWPSIRI